MSYPNFDTDARPFKPTSCVRHRGEEIVVVDSANMDPPGSPEWSSNCSSGVTWGVWEYRAKTYSDPPEAGEVCNALMYMGSWNWSTGKTYGFAPRHGYASNCLYFDGHADTVDGEYLWNMDWTNPDGNNPMDGY